MSGIQVLLLLAAAVWVTLFLRGTPSSNTSRLMGLATAGAVIVLALAPELSTHLAHLLGVTRGVDLVLYLAIVALGFLWLQQSARIRQLDLRLARLVRRLALEQPERRESGAGEDAAGSAGRHDAG